MTAIKEAPVCPNPGKNDAHKGELETFAVLKDRQQKFLSYIIRQHPEQVNLIADLGSCAQRLFFRHYENGERRYAGGCTCKHYLSCDPCNYLRAVTASETYGTAIRRIMDKGNLWPFRISIVSEPSSNPVAQAVHLKAVHDRLRTSHNGKKRFPGGVLSFTFQAVPEGFQGILSSVLLVDLRRLSSIEGATDQISKIIQQAHPDLVFSVLPLVSDFWDQEDLLSELWAAFSMIGLRPDPANSHAKRWELSSMISRYNLLQGFGCLGGIVLRDSSQPVIPDLPFTGELNVYGGDYTFAGEVDSFPLEHFKRTSRPRGLGSTYRKFCDRRWKSILRRFSDFGIDPGDDLPATPSELAHFRRCNAITRRDLARWSGFSKYLIKQWEEGKVIPPPFAGALYLLYYVQRHEVTV